MTEPTWFLYILRTGTFKLYTGISPDPEARLKKHNSGKGAKFTRVGGPWVIVYLEPVGSKGDALRRERAVKKLSRAQKLQLIQRGSRPSGSQPATGST